MFHLLIDESMFGLLEQFPKLFTVPTLQLNKRSNDSVSFSEEKDVTLMDIIVLV